MPHVKTMFDPSEWLFAHDLQGRSVVLTIAKVEAGTITGSGGKTNRKPVVTFEGKTKKLALNKTNAKTILTMYGTETDDWVGKAIEIYPTTTSMGSETVECVRVKPIVPAVPK